MTRLPFLALIAASASAAPALASTDEAWATFRAEVETQCRALVGPPKGARVMVEVSPEGSENYGVALITVGLPAGGAERSICIMDKHSRKAEIATPLPQTEGEGAAAGGGMGKAQHKGPTAGDARAPVAKPAAKAEAAQAEATKAEAAKPDTAKTGAAKAEAEMVKAATNSAAKATTTHSNTGKPQEATPAPTPPQPAPVVPPQPKPAG